MTVRSPRPQPGIEAIQVARTLATDAHRGQVDRAGRPYIDHPARVAAFLAGDERWQLQVIAWLHDVVEDTDVTVEDLAQLFDQDVLEAVVAITHRPHEPRADYYARVRANPWALVVKAADLRDNTDPQRVASLDADTAARLRTKYAGARQALGLPSGSEVAVEAAARVISPLAFDEAHLPLMPFGWTGTIEEGRERDRELARATARAALDAAALAQLRDRELPADG